MKAKFNLLMMALLVIAVAAIAGYLVRHLRPAVLYPKGYIGLQERDLIVTATLLMLIVVLPVFILIFWIAWRYREGNRSAKYSPDWDHDVKLELMWWGIPLAIITILALITWQSSRDLDPFKPLASSSRPLNVQVVALDWKWLFIYPEQDIATVNYLQLPMARPVNFEITSDAPMNSFWIPELGGQIYAMSGMSTQLHLIANQRGTFNGSSANISGQGFASMKFRVAANPQTDFDTWVKTVKRQPHRLQKDSYQNLARPGTVNQPKLYSSVQPGLYHQIIDKYVGPGPLGSGARQGG